MNSGIMGMCERQTHSSQRALETGCLLNELLVFYHLGFILMCTWEDIVLFFKCLSNQRN